MSDSSLSSPIWGRRHDRTASTMSRRLYLLMVCGWTAAGIAFSAVMSNFSNDWDLTSWNSWEVLGFYLGVLAVALGGAFIANASSNPAVSLVGYVLIAGPFGLMLGPTLALYEPESVLKIFILTSGVVLILGIVGALIPDDLSAWGIWLFGGLLFLIGGYLLVPIAGFFGFPVETGMTWLDVIGVALFGGLVIFDLNRAVRLPYTVDNAVDSAVAIYLDFVNIFIRLLSLMGQKK